MGGKQKPLKFKCSDCKVYHFGHYCNKKQKTTYYDTNACREFQPSKYTQNKYCVVS